MPVLISAAGLRWCWWCRLCFMAGNYLLSLTPSSPLRTVHAQIWYSILGRISFLLVISESGMMWVWVGVLLVEKRNLYSPFSDTWHVGPPQVGRHLAHPPHTLLLHFCRTDSHCTCGCPLWACGGVTCKMSLPAVTSPKAQWLTPKLMALPPAGEDGDDHECINMPPKIKMTKLHKTLNTCKI